MRRALVATATLGALLLIGLPAAADPAGPTSYETTIVAVEPPIDGISVRMLGGDSFIELTVDPGVDVVVTGYRGEPYLWFAPDGTVSRNTRSESTYLNEDRYADADIPAEADNAADPVWEAVADGGRYAWHDHRTHWMNPDPPPSAEPGDTILEAAVPLAVDGMATIVTVRSVYVEPPSPWAASLGAVFGLVVAAGATRLGPAGPRGALIGFGGAAGVVGLWERLSMPEEAAASALVFLLPIGVVAFAGIARPPVSGIALGLASAQLVAWAVVRWPVLAEPILPTGAPWPLDRFVTAMALTGGIACLVTAIRVIAGRASTE